jgi:hypothetical protein
VAARSGRETYDDPVNDRFMTDVVRRLVAVEAEVRRVSEENGKLKKQVERLKRNA